MGIIRGKFKYRAISLIYSRSRPSSFSSGFSKASGFSIVELLFAITISMLAIFGVAMIMTNAMQHEMFMARRTNSAVENRRVGSYFIAMTENMGPSFDFMNLPIKYLAATATDLTPAVRQYFPDAGRRFFRNVTTDELNLVDISGIASQADITLHFYKDVLGNIDVSLQDSTTAKNSALALVQFDSAVNQNAPYANALTSTAAAAYNNNQGQYYATWPLFNSNFNGVSTFNTVNQQPFIILKGTGGNASFQYVSFKDDQFEQSNGYVLFAKSELTTSAELQKLTGKLMAIYDAAHPERYFVQRIADIEDCTTTCSHGSTIVSNFGDATISANFNAEKSKYAAILLDSNLNLAKFMGVQSDTYTANTGATPDNYPFCGAYCDASSSGVPPNPSFFFPTTVSSFFRLELDTGSVRYLIGSNQGNQSHNKSNGYYFVNSAGAAGLIDNMLHAELFYNNGNYPQLVAAPLDLMKFQIISNADNSHTFLQQTTFNRPGAGASDNDVVFNLMDNVDGKAIVFARKLGSGEFSAFIFDADQCWLRDGTTSTDPCVSD